MTPAARRVLTARVAQELAAARAELGEALLCEARAEAAWVRAREALRATEEARGEARTALRGVSGRTDEAAVWRARDARLAAATAQCERAREALGREDAVRAEARAVLDRAQRRVAGALEAVRAVEAQDAAAAREARRARE